MWEEPPGPSRSRTRRAPRPIFFQSPIGAFRSVTRAAPTIPWVAHALPTGAVSNDCLDVPPAATLVDLVPLGDQAGDRFPGEAAALERDAVGERLMVHARRR